MHRLLNCHCHGAFFAQHACAEIHLVRLRITILANGQTVYVRSKIKPNHLTALASSSI